MLATPAALACTLGAQRYRQGGEALTNTPEPWLDVVRIGSMGGGTARLHFILFTRRRLIALHVCMLLLPFWVECVGGGGGWMVVSFGRLPV